MVISKSLRITTIKYNVFSVRELSKTPQHSDLGKNPTSNSVGFLVAQTLYFSKIYKSSVCVHVSVCFFQKLNVDR